jgi:hypothetical protein
MYTARRLVGEHIAGLTAVHVLVDLGVTTERGSQFRDTIPEGAE